MTYFFFDHDNIEDMLWLERNDPTTYDKIKKEDVRKKRTTTLFLYKCDIDRFINQLFDKF